MLRSNDLVAVHVPDSLDEAIRYLHRAKIRLLVLLRRLCYQYDDKSHWT